MLRLSLVAAVSLALIGCDGDSTAPVQDSVVLATDFEAGFDGWVMQGSIPADASITLGTAEGLSGQCAMLAHNNRLGTFYQWIERDVSVDVVGSAVRVDWILGNVGSRSLLRQPIIVVSLAETGELSESDFRTLGLIGDPNGTNVPVSLSERFDVAVGEGATIRVGVGFTTGWEVEQRLCVDDIVITVIP